MFIRLSVFLFIYLSAYLPELFTFVYLAVYFSSDRCCRYCSTCLFVYLSIYYICLSICIFVYLPVILFSISSYVCLFAYLSVYLSSSFDCMYIMFCFFFMHRLILIIIFCVFSIACLRVSPYFRFSVVKTPFWPCGAPGKARSVHGYL